MKLLLALFATLMIFGCQNNSSDVPNLSKPKDEKDRISYAIGYDIGNNLRKDDIDVNTEYFLRGLIDGLNKDTLNKNVLLSEEERTQASQDFQTLIKAKAELEQQEKLKEHRAKGDAFKSEGEKYLAENKTKKGVVTLPSGMQYTVINSGKGKKATVNDIVLMHLVAKLTDGTEFENTYKNGQPAQLPVAQLIPGWQEIIPLMKVGDKWEVVIPSHLAYGEEGYPDVIPPNATLIFEMELIEIMK